MLFSFIELLPKAINKAYVLLYKVVKQHFNLKLGILVYKKIQYRAQILEKTSDPLKNVQFKYFTL